MDLATVLWTGLTIAGMAGAYGAGRTQRRSKPSVAQAMCPCGDAISFHENHKGKCRAVTEVWINGRDTTRECACQAYAGPELISGVTGRGILPIDPA